MEWKFQSKKRSQDPITQPPTLAGPALIHSLPDELLILIFVFSNPLEGTQFNCSSSTKRPPISSTSLTLSHVCSRWRSVALSASQIWATITLFDVDEAFIFDPYAKPLLMHLHRSREAPLTIRVKNRNHDRLSFRPPTDSEMYIFSLINDHSRKLRHIHAYRLDALWMAMCTTSSTTTPTPEYHLPFESLSFNASSNDFGGNQKLNRMFRYTSFPNLKYLSIVSLGDSPAFTRELRLPYIQLHSLTFECGGDIDLPHVLSACSNLYSLNMKLYPRRLPHRPHWYTSDSTVSLPRLKGLTVHLELVDSSLMQSVLECLSCPSLTSLTLHNDSWRTSSVGVSSELLKDIHEAFCAFIRKVSRSLVRLNLQETLAMSRPFAPVFQMCRVLEDLSIREAGLAPPDMDIDPVLRGLVATSEQPLLLPSLRNLIVSVNGRWASKETLLLIREVIISREASQQSRTLESAVFVLPETIVHGRTDLSEFYDIQRRNTTVVKVAGFLSEKVFVGYTELQLDYPEVKNTEVSVPSVFLSGWKWWEKVARFIW